MARLRLRVQAGLATAGLAFASGTGAYAYASLTTGAAAEGNLDTAGMAMAIPILPVPGLSPILHRRDDWLLETASTVAHNNISVLAVLGKPIGRFSSDRAIGEYCEEIWNVPAVTVRL